MSCVLMTHVLMLIFNTADQTPTPSKFLRNCEEMGLFHELSKNPFEEAFKKASDENKHLELNEVCTYVCVGRVATDLLLNSPRH